MRNSVQLRESVGQKKLLLQEEAIHCPMRERIQRITNLRTKKRKEVLPCFNHQIFILRIEGWTRQCRTSTAFLFVFTETQQMNTLREHEEVRKHTVC